MTGDDRAKANLPSSRRLVSAFAATLSGSWGWRPQIILPIGMFLVDLVVARAGCAHLGRTGGVTRGFPGPFPAFRQAISIGLDTTRPEAIRWLIDARLHGSSAAEENLPFPCT